MMPFNLPFKPRRFLLSDSQHEAQRLSLVLLESRGETHGTRTAKQLRKALSLLDHEEELAYNFWLVEKLGPVAQSLSSSAVAWLAHPDAVRAADVARHAEPRRQELLRRLNAAPGGTRYLIDWRARLLRHLPSYPELAPLEADLKHLLASWFNRGFLILRPITWDSPARVLDHLIAHEAVHSICGWEDLRGRLEGDRRCYAFFHPALPDVPIIFVEVALTDTVSDAIAPLLDHPPQRTSPVNPSTAIFYSISNCEPGLRGLNFGNFLIKQITTDLKAEYPSLSTFATLSPVPGFRRWLDAGGRELVDGANRLERLCAQYLTGKSPDGIDGMPCDPVAAFHLGNGAELWRINLDADLSSKGMKQSEGIMVNYLYRDERMVINHEQFMTAGIVAQSRYVSQLLKANHRTVTRWPASWMRARNLITKQEKPTWR